MLKESKETRKTREAGTNETVQKIKAWKTSEKGEGSRRGSLQ